MGGTASVVVSNLSSDCRKGDGKYIQAPEVEEPVSESDHSRSGSNIRRGRKRVEKDGDSQSLSSFRRRREGDGQSSSISRVALKHLSTNLSASREAGGSRTREAGGSRSYRLGGNSNIDASSYSRFRELSSNPVYDEDNSGISHVSALEPLAPLDAIFEEKGVGTPSGARATGGGYFQARGAIPVSEAIAVGDSVQLPPETSLPTTSSSNVAPKPKSTFKKRMPSLAISVEAEDNYDNVADDMVAFLKNQSTVITKLSPHSVSDCSESISPSDKFEASNSGVPNASRAAVGAGGHSSNRKQCSSSSDSIVRVGDFKIRETGLSMSTGDDNSYRLGGNSITRRPRYGATQRSAFVSLGGSFNFIEINALGQGASGAVVEALHVPTLTIVALKMLPSYNQQKRANIESELAVLYKNMAQLKLVDDILVDNEQNDTSSQKKTKVHCPYVVALYDAFNDPKTGLINLVIEYMDGGSLADVVKAGGLPEEEALADISMQVLQGLQYLHSLEQMHRDIKPGNILLNCDGQVKLADFGISKAVDGNKGYANSFVGTMTYMSPERIVGETYGYPSDIWSLGVTIFAVAEGGFPFKQEDSGYWGMIKAVCDEPVPIPDPQKYSPEFRNFIACMLDKNPATRHTADQLLEHVFIQMGLDSEDCLAAQSPQAVALSPGVSSLSHWTSSRVFSSGSTRDASNVDIDPVKIEHLDLILDSLYDTVRTAVIAASSLEDTAINKSMSVDEVHLMNKNNLLSNGVDLNSADSLCAAAADLHLQSTFPTTDSAASKCSIVRASSVKIRNAPKLETIVSYNGGSPRSSPSDEKCSNLFSHNKTLPKPLAQSNLKPPPTTTSMMLMRNLLKVPGFTSPQDLRQWKELARQLHLPYDLVLNSAKLQLSGILESLNGNGPNKGFPIASHPPSTNNSITRRA